MNKSFSHKSNRQAPPPTNYNFLLNQFKPQNIKLYEVQSIIEQQSDKKSQINKYESQGPLVFKKCQQKIVEKQQQKIDIYYIEYLKGVLIFKQIIEPIEGDDLLNFENEKYLQFMLLVSRRASKYVQNFYHQLKISQQKGIKNPQIQDLIDIPELQAYNLTLLAKFKAYNRNIDLFNRKFRKRIRSVSDVVYQSPQRKTKYKFLDGYEGPDFTEDQQVQFTYNRYIEQIINSQKIRSQYFKNHRLKKILKSYKQICGIRSKYCQQKNQQHSYVGDFNDFKKNVEQILKRRR